MRIHPSPHGRLIAAALVASLAACTSSSPGGSSAAPTASIQAPAAGSPVASPSKPGTPSASPGENASTFVRIRPPRGGSFLVRGSYPHVTSRCKAFEQPTLTARYPGTLAVKRSGDGTLALTVTLPFERYLEGIAEVSPTWPMAALEAQAIAARSYALATTGWSGEEGQTLDEPICATASCQVYGGIPVPRQPGIGRWYRAVRNTAGHVLLHAGAPATTVYFSTSNGRTYGNDEVFGSAPLPYLRPVVERDDGASPTSHWRVRMPFGDLARFLRAAGAWPRGRPIRAVRPRGGAVAVTGGGAKRSIDPDTLQDAVNTWAPCLEPGRYPPQGPNGTLPLTIPSDWSRISSGKGALVVTGRGWGHGVGMVQWGAYGKARRGFSAEEILSYYYGGLRPRMYPEPGLIHVQVEMGLASMRIVASGPGAMLNGHPIGSGTVLVTGGDRLTVDA